MGDIIHFISLDPGYNLEFKLKNNNYLELVAAIAPNAGSSFHSTRSWPLCRLGSMLGGLLVEPRRVMLVYWGRRGLTQFAFEIASTAAANHGPIATFSVSRQNEMFDAFANTGIDLFPVDTFSTNLGALTEA